MKQLLVKAYGGDPFPLMAVVLAVAALASVGFLIGAAAVTIVMLLTGGAA